MSSSNYIQLIYVLKDLTVLRQLRKKLIPIKQYTPHNCILTDNRDKKLDTRM